MSSDPSTTSSASEELLVEGVWKSFGDTPVLRDVTLRIPHGQFVTMLGPSGCGKTTILRIIAGLEKANAGQITLCGRNITSLPANRRPINTVFQNYALFPHLDVFENVAFGLRSRGLAGERILAGVGGVLRMLQLEGLEKRYPHQLSGGQKQRVALARALVNEPEVLLLDEPMSALDAKLRATVQLELRRLQRQLGKTFLLVTHDQDEAMTVSDLIFVMHEGRIEQAGTPTEVYEHPVNRFVAEFLGSANLISASAAGNGMVSTALGSLVVKAAPLWTTGTVAIRPERIRLVAELPALNGVRATVRELIYRGDHVDIFVEPGPLRVRTSVMHGPRVGSEVCLELPKEHLELLVD